ncbi:expressed unknown protein [Seminavis robusta]|uniref:Uncharacterized protein n=1 Tax=Seminavis robusta TaxID=568900 RepID=A0A9N8HDT1_9STRA|nr:expressed unknown protein [Seminavis robusta]|eukprot:Sro271_g104520.1 n/a (178) ;mRNA; f:29639-30172
MTNLPLHFYLRDLIGSCPELPQVVADNPRCGACDQDQHYPPAHNNNNNMSLDCSTHSTSSQHSSRWDSMPKAIMDNRMRYPSRDPVAAVHKNDPRLTLKQPKRTGSFETNFALKDGLLPPRNRGRSSASTASSSSLQSSGSHHRNTIILPTQPRSGVHEILDQAMDELQLNNSPQHV